MIEEERLLEGGSTEQELVQESALRPQRLADYTGQDKVRDQLDLAIRAARKRGETLDHVLIYGPPGLGKTTLAHILAREMGGTLKTTSGPALDKARDLAGELMKLEEGDVLFIDEIHRLSPVIEEYLYPAMEDFHIDVVLGSDDAARTMKLNLPRFTLVGATTRAGLLTSPLRDRFGIVQRLEYYDAQDLASIVRRSAGLLGVPVSEDGAREVACRARGTPRIANRLLRRVQDYAEVHGDGQITLEIADRALSMLEVDERGFDSLDRRFLRTMLEHFNGGPVGVESLAASLGEDRGTIEEVLEPYLIQQGFVTRTLRGRILTNRGWQHFGLRSPSAATAEGDLFAGDDQGD